MNNILNYLKRIYMCAHEQGIRLPMFRDPASNKPSVTLTMTVLSFNTCLLGQIGKIAKLLGDVDLTQANYLFLMCLGAYLGRRLQGNGTTKEISLENKE